MKRLLLAFVASVALATSAAAQITIPYPSFQPNADILSAEVNANNTEITAKALNRAGGTVTGNIAVDNGITIDGLDLSAVIANKTSTATISGAWTFTASPTLSADLLFTDATYDIGKTGATRPRDLFLSRNAVVGGTLAVTGVPTFSASTIGLRGVTYTLPSADATSSGYALTSNAAGTLSWASAGGLRLIATSDSEVTTTSGSITNVKSISGLSIPKTSTIIVVFTVRKTSGAANDMRYRIGVNGSPQQSERQIISAANATGSGEVIAIIGPHDASYLKSFAAITAGSDGTTSNESVHGPDSTTSLPNATITSIEIDIRNNGGSITVGVANVKVFELAGV